MAADAQPVVAVAGRGASRRRRRVSLRLALVFGLVAVGVWTTASFARSAPGTAAPMRVRQLADGLQLPSGVRALRYSTSAPDGRLRWQAPGWIVRAEEPVSVTTAGDLALVDAHGTSTVTISLYVTNLVALRYRSFALPVEVWQSTDPVTRTSWRRAAVAAKLLGGGTGRVSFTLRGGCYYDVTLARGGSLVALPGRRDYSPSFYATVD